MKILRRAAMWWFKNEWVPMPGSWTPHILAFALGAKEYGIVKKGN